MHAVTKKKSEEMKIVLGPIRPRLRFVGTGRNTVHADKRRKGPRTARRDIDQN